VFLRRLSDYGIAPQPMTPRTLQRPSPARVIPLWISSGYVDRSPLRGKTLSLHVSTGAERWSAQLVAYCARNSAGGPGAARRPKYPACKASNAGHAAIHAVGRTCASIFPATAIDPGADLAAGNSSCRRTGEAAQALIHSEVRPPIGWSLREREGAVSFWLGVRRGVTLAVNEPLVRGCGISSWPRSMHRRGSLISPADPSGRARQASLAGRGTEQRAHAPLTTARSGRRNVLLLACGWLDKHGQLGSDSTGEWNYRCSWVLQCLLSSC